MDIKRDFDAFAAAWDDNPVRVKLARDISSAMAGAIKITSGMDVLDFGCGTGLVTLALQPLAGTVTGMDSSRGMLEALDRKISSAGLTNMKTVYHDADADVPIPGRYHAMVSSMALHHVQNIGPLLKKFYSALVPGGILCVADLDPDGGMFHPDNTGVFHFGFDRKKMRELFREAGFHDMTDSTAAEVARPQQGGGMKSFTVFLMTGRK